jgi:hypothetical protein
MIFFPLCCAYVASFYNWGFRNKLEIDVAPKVLKYTMAQNSKIHNEIHYKPYTIHINGDNLQAP